MLYAKVGVYASAPPLPPLPLTSLVLGTVRVQQCQRAPPEQQHHGHRPGLQREWLRHQGRHHLRQQRLPDISELRIAE